MNDYLAASNATSLLDMANGAIKERIDYEMGRVMQNMCASPSAPARLLRKKLTGWVWNLPSDLLKATMPLWSALT